MSDQIIAYHCAESSFLVTGECWLSFAQRPDAHTHGMFARRVETRHVIDVGSNNTPEPPLDIVAPEF